MEDQGKMDWEVRVWKDSSLPSPAESAIQFSYPAFSTPTTELFLKQRNKTNPFYWEKHSDTLTHPLDRKSLPAPQV